MTDKAWASNTGRSGGDVLHSFAPDAGRRDVFVPVAVLLGLCSKNGGLVWEGMGATDFGQPELFRMFAQHYDQ